MAASAKRVMVSYGGRRAAGWAAIGVVLATGLAYLFFAGRAGSPQPVRTILQRASAPAAAGGVNRHAQERWAAQADAESGMALLQQVRETNDTTLYGRAGAAFDAALALDSENVDAMVGRGALALALHDFSGALTWADRVLAQNPYRAAGYGIRVDALVELGRYEQALAIAQAMVDLRPDLESYSRVSYLRELHGDMDGAIAAMEAAVQTATRGTEPWLWTVTQLGKLWSARGDLAQAELAYRAVLQQRATYPFAQAGMAHVLAARGDFTAAIAILESLVERLPMPEFLAQLGELYLVTGRGQLAAHQFELIQVIQQLNRGAGMNVDLEFAAFAVQHGEDEAAALAAAEAAYAARPTIYAADTLAWALYRVGRYTEAARYSDEARRLGTQDAQLWYRAGMIADALGEEAVAVQRLRRALQLNSTFSPLDAVMAREVLASLTGLVLPSATPVLHHDGSEFSDF